MCGISCILQQNGSCKQVKEEENDTQVLLDLLSISYEPHHVLNTVGKSEGPWSFVYYQNATKQLWFGRDVFGRRSLLWHLPESDDDPFILSSVQTCDKSRNDGNSLATNTGHKISDPLNLTSRTSMLDVSTDDTSVNQQLDVEEMISSSKHGNSEAEKSSQSAFANSKVAILFSGGIDSAMIAALVDRCLPECEPIDLINVAFEQQPKGTVKKKSNVSLERSEENRWNVPDRETGHRALAELNPNRTWNFVEVQIMYSVHFFGKISCRSTDIRHLVYPLETVLDDSIGSAVWFAARGHGILGNGIHTGKPYISKAKVILCGMGADEQFAGYSRHRGKYQ
ncbi:hypothetical protein FSP39_024533 [Pinctada imbricata]|uniref:Uncharacterized protein n=1 Tax=Pinctada imbricata TaxID=66713 RepID=A0AA88XUL5_PINIB|nr:hypothetical protein FSP39_024533 [Pinctada imbricata]